MMDSFENSPGTTTSRDADMLEALIAAATVGTTRPVTAAVTEAVVRMWQSERDSGRDPRALDVVLRHTPEGVYWELSGDVDADKPSPAV